MFNTTDHPKEIAITLREFGQTGPVRLQDLWTGRDAGTMAGRVSRMVAPHGAELYRLG